MCEIDWDAATVRLWTRPVTDDAIVTAVAETDRAAFDIPLGWPDEFVAALVAHQWGLDWPPAEEEPPGDRMHLRFRWTDRHLQQAHHQPLSVSTDRIGVAAFRGARLQHLLRTVDVEVDRSGMTGRVLEAYPAAALRSWELRHTGYKGKAKADELRALVLEAVARCGSLRTVAAATLEEADHDDFDAFVCALVARAASLGYTRCPGEAELEVARREGWVHVPTESVEKIVSS
jgi:hypothetical protein